MPKCMIFCAALTVALHFTGPTLRADLTAEQAEELARMDAVATTLGSLDSWIRNSPDQAAIAIGQKEQLVAWTNDRLKKYANFDRSTLFGQRLQDRVKQLKSGLSRWQSSEERFLKNAPKYVSDTITRLQRTIDKTNKPSAVRTYAAICDSGRQQIQTQLTVLEAFGKTPAELKSRIEAMNKSIGEIEQDYAADLRKSRRVPRDSYRKDDRDQLTAAVTKQWQKLHPDDEVITVIFRKGYWQRLYGATWNAKSKTFDVLDVESLPLYVVTTSENGAAKLHPYELHRKTKSDEIAGGRQTSDLAYEVDRNAIK